VWRLYDRRGFACRAVWQSLPALQRRVSGYFEVNATTAGFAYLLGILPDSCCLGSDRIPCVVSYRHSLLQLLFSSAHRPPNHF